MFELNRHFLNFTHSLIVCHLFSAALCRVGAGARQKYLTGFVHILENLENTEILRLESQALNILEFHSPKFRENTRMCLNFCCHRSFNPIYIWAPLYL